MCLFRGVAPIYKPGNRQPAKYPEDDFGYISPDLADR
jgi:hypothetical protein